MPLLENSTVKFNTAASSFTGTLPSGVNEGELLLAMTVTGDNRDLVSTSGYTLIGVSTVETNQSAHLWAKEAGPSEGNPGWSFVIGGNTSVSSVLMACVSGQYADFFGITDLTVNTTPNANDPNTTLPAIDTETNNELVLAFGSMTVLGGIATPSTFTEAIDSGGPSSVMGLFQKTMASPGSSGDVVIAPSSPSNGRVAGFLVSICDAASTPPKKPRVMGLAYSNTGTSNPTNVDLPPNVPEGAIILIQIWVRNSLTVASLSGYSQLGSNVGEGTTINSALFYKVAGPSEGAASFSNPGALIYKSTVVVLEKSRSTTPTDGLSSFATAGSNVSTATLPQIDPVLFNELMLMFLTSNGDQHTVTPSTTAAKRRMQHIFEGITGTQTLFVERLANASPTGSRVFTQNAGSRHAAHMVSVKPELLPAPANLVVESEVFQ